MSRFEIIFTLNFQNICSFSLASSVIVEECMPISVCVCLSFLIVQDNVHLCKSLFIHVLLTA